ncbi:uncharacterized protein LOC125271627 isoform X2 [Megalobrama amblycephala]|uniref:uncharacterized protein LOC125271627 isoform X2 n=1 Tax=Megalobrama amblycephala TaxID=75352 RepID=UPI0020146E8C|nr:uncharacterized protein LOC125271627 isoform X2 [Megalobrama amblycephala]
MLSLKLKDDKRKECGISRQDFTRGKGLHETDYKIQPILTIKQTIFPLQIQFKNQEGFISSSPKVHQSLYIISVFLLYITGSCSSSVVRVEGFVGGSAVFTCSIPESEIKDNIKKFNLHVRDIEGKTVCDIIGGDRTCQGQAPEYKARTEILPNAQKEGNFTIKLNWLKKNDARKYTCIFTGPFQNEIYLELDVKDCHGAHKNKMVRSKCSDVY